MTRIAAIAFALGTFIGATASAQPAALGADSFQILDYGIFPHSLTKSALLRMKPIREELKMTDAQKEALSSPTYLELIERKMEAVRRVEDPKKRNATSDVDPNWMSIHKQMAASDAVQRDLKRMAASDAATKEIDAAAVKFLEPEQRERLDQLQLQLDGPVAFLRPDFQKRLGLFRSQPSIIGGIVAEGSTKMRKTSIVPLPAGLKLEDRAGGLEALRKQVDTPEFRAATEKARRETRDVWEATIRRIGRVLTGPQRVQYVQMLGARFDATKLRKEDDSRSAIQFLAVKAGVAGERVDPDFDSKVARPACTETHPRALFDEAHHNIDTAGGPYKPFADLIASDGYQVIPNREKFTRSVLDKADILVISNPLGAEKKWSPGSEKPAFGDDECAAVRDWVSDGGALLLISNDGPMGSAAAGLAKWFGVEMSQGMVIDPKDSEGHPSQLVFSRENQLLGDQPITRGRDESERVGRVKTFTGQSLRGPEGSVAFLKLGEAATDKGRPGGKPVSIAGRSQGLALPYGKGRVVVLGESRQLSALIFGVDREPMGMNVPGVDNRQMALNIMHWLSGLIDSRRD